MAPELLLGTAVGADRMKPIDPQLKAALGQVGLQPTEEAWLRLNSLGKLLYERGTLDAALDVFLASLAMAECLHGRDREHPDTLTSMANVSAVLQAKGKLAEAEPYCREALEKRRRVLGKEHRDTLTSMNNMGILLQAQGKLAEAEPYCREALEKCLRVLGEEDSLAFVSTNNMGMLLHAQGKLLESRLHYLWALPKCRRVLGEEHPSTLTLIHNIGDVLWSQGRLAEAEPYWREALKKRRRVLGEMHPDTLSSIDSMGSLLQNQGKLDQAEPYYCDALEKRRRVLGEEHPDTLGSLSNLGGLLQALGRLAEAESMFAQAMCASEVLRSAAFGVVGRASMSGALNLSMTTAILSALRARLDRPVESVLAAIESGSSRSILDLLQSNGMDRGAAAAERVRAGQWSTERAARYEADLVRSVELEFQDKRLLDQGVPLENPERQGIAQELSEVRKRLYEAEKELLPSARPCELPKIRAALREGEVLLVYGWSWLGVSLVAVPHADLGEGPSAHWVSKVDEATTPPETAKRERALIDTMQSVAVLIGAGLAPEPARAMQVANSWTMLEAEADLANRLDATTIKDVKRLVVGLQTAADALAKDPKKKLGVPSMPIGSLGALARVLLEFAVPEAIRPMLGRAARLIVVPSGPLHELPLEVLIGLANFAELKNKPVTLVPSGSILALIRSQGGDVRPDGITAVGDPDADLPGAGRGGDPFHVSELDSLLGDRAAGHGRLPRARTEATLVAEYQGGTPLIDTDATPSRLRAEAPGKRVLHIAAHAVLGAMGDPMASAILLSREPGPDGQPGASRLSVGDLIATWGDRLKGCELAVLSCCQTGRGVQVGDSLMALPIGLLHAGVNSIVASLWKVDDLATCLLMTRFHQNLLGDHRTLSEEIDGVVRTVWGHEYRRGEPMPMTQALAEARAWLQQLPSEALSYFAEKQPLPPRHFTDERGKTTISPSDVQIAQRRATLTGKPPYADPCYWAAFVLIGG
jgi:CHAT domain-containing protein/tetratricopeptide (TPR) repeat protein